MIYSKQKNFGRYKKGKEKALVFFNKPGFRAERRFGY